MDFGKSDKMSPFSAAGIAMLIDGLGEGVLRWPPIAPRYCIC
jgi:hypothetical protein